MGVGGCGMTLYGSYHPNERLKQKPSREICSKKPCRYLKIEDGNYICDESVWYIKEKKDFVYLEVEDIPYCPCPIDLKDI